MGLDRRTARKTPAVIALFWVVKVLTTAMGESVSDYSVHRFDPVVAVAGGFVCLVAALLVQLATTRYVAWAYWLCVSMVAVFGTMAADVLHVRFHVPYAASSTLFAVALVVVFVAWARVEHTLSIHSVVTLRCELFYWATVGATFALGTALGDFAATTLGLGYLGAAVLFAALIAVPALVWRLLGTNEVLWFWAAYVVTRPLGASIADWLGKPASAGGLGLGDGVVGATLAALLVAAVAYLSVSRRDVPVAPSPTAGEG